MLKKLLPIIMSLTFMILVLAGCPSPGDSSSEDPDEDLSNTKTVLSFVLTAADNTALSADITADISGTSITATMPYGTDVTSLIPAITHNGSTISPASGASADFTNPVAYTVTAEDGGKNIYTVTLAIATSDAKEITAFRFTSDANSSLTGDVAASISGTNITATMPYGTDITTLVPLITHTGAGISPASGVSTNFSSPVEYTVTAGDGTTAKYTVTLTVALNDAKEITAFSFTKAANSSLTNDVAATISGTAITATLPYGTDATELVATFTATGETVEASGEEQTSGVSEVDFTGTVTYTVTAEDTTQKAYSVKVTVLGAKEASGFTGSSSVGNTAVVTLGTPSKTFTMVYANDRSSITFPISVFGDTDFTESSTATITRKFWIGQTELTCATVAAVYQWAYNNGRFSTTASAHNRVSTTTVKYGSQELINLDYSVSSGYTCRIKYSAGVFSVESGYENYPADCMTWYGCVMFCNWLTEMRDGSTDNVVYTGIDTSWDDDETVTNADRNGYRIQTFNEWTYSAKYLGTSVPTEGDLASEYVARDVNGGSSSLTAGYYWLPGDYASGAVYDVTNEAACRAVAVYYYGQNTPEMCAVKSLAPNSLGLYDMCGNTYEITSDNYSSGWKYMLGSNNCNSAASLMVGSYYMNTPDYANQDYGFRICRTAD